MSAKKNDQDKPQLHLLPYSALKAAAYGFMFGAKKYDKWNWRQGFDWSRLADAASRHINEFVDGRDSDPESQLNPIAHALCCLMMLYEHIEKNLGKDDRYVRTKDIPEHTKPIVQSDDTFAQLEAIRNKSGHTVRINTEDATGYNIRPKQGPGLRNENSPQEPQPWYYTGRKFPKW